jgi:hypothetical protein
VPLACTCKETVFPAALPWSAGVTTVIGLLTFQVNVAWAL